jgi:hypothetical protein
MLTSVLIIVLSAMLLAYWFRHTCLLLLNSELDARSVRTVVEANNLSVLAVREALEQNSSDALESLERSLDRDFRVMQFLLAQSADLGGAELERLVLAIDFRLMQLWYHVTRYASPRASRQALCEMSAIVSCFAGFMGQRAVS